MIFVLWLQTSFLCLSSIGVDISLAKLLRYRYGLRLVTRNSVMSVLGF